MGQLPTLDFSLLENFLSKIIDWEGILTLKLRKHGWTEHSEVVYEILGAF